MLHHRYLGNTLCIVIPHQRLHNLRVEVIRKASSQCLYEKYNILDNKLLNNFDDVLSFRYL